MKKLHIGVIGLGLGKHHITSYLEADAEEALIDRLVVCDVNPAALESIQIEHPIIAAGYADLETMLATESLDAVSIVTPDHLHRGHAEACLAAGCHVLMTKPLATNLDDGRAIVRAAAASDRVFMIAHERRFRSRVKAIKEMLEAGDLGQIIHLRIDAIQDKRGQFQRSPWYASAEAGRTALVGSGIHEVDLLRYLVDRPVESVSAYSNRLGTLEFPKDKTTAAIYQFSGGTVGQVTVTYEAHWPKGPGGGSIDDHFRLVGTKGMIVGGKTAKDGQAGWHDLPDDERAIVTGTQGCVQAFLRSILEGEPVAVTALDAFTSLAAAVAADQSAASGKPVAPAIL